MKILSLLFFSIFAISQPSIPISDHYDGTRFFNEDPHVVKKSLFDVLKWKLGKKEKEEKIERPLAIPNFPTAIDSDEVFVTFINHATALIQMKNLTILTDPVFSEYVGPISLLSVERSQKSGLSLTDLPKIDIVLISHNHYDHLDLPSLQQILKRDDPLFILPLKNGYLLRDIGARKLIELDWWQSTEINQKQKIILTPAQHWSARSLFDDSKSLWGGFVILSDEIKVFFAGDTGYAKHFKEIYNRFGAMDVSLLPIGCYKPRWFMFQQHMDPDDAVIAHLDLHSKLSIGIHFGTFKLADDGINQPVIDLYEALKNRSVPPSQFLAPLNGETLTYKK